MSDAFTRSPANKPKPTTASNTYDICIQSAAAVATAAALCCYSAVVVAAARHRTPAARARCFCCCSSSYTRHPSEVVLHTNSSNTYCQFISYYERKDFSTPLGSTFAFVRLRLLPILYLSWPLREVTEASARRGEDPPVI